MAKPLKGKNQSPLPVFASAPHSGLKIPSQAGWLKGLPDSILLCDADLFVDQLYGPALKAFQVPFLVFPYHRYAVDAGRFAEDVSPLIVEGAMPAPASDSPSFIHWHKTTKGDLLIKKPLSQKTHRELLRACFEPFHKKIRDQFADFRKKGFRQILLLDLHSMPSAGTDFHKDPGRKRPDVVLGDAGGLSASGFFRSLTERAFQRAGFKTAWNWPYKGGGITQTYGDPASGASALQIELNRALYMDEGSKQKSEDFQKIREKLKKAMAFIVKGLRDGGGAPPPPDQP